MFIMKICFLKKKINADRDVINYNLNMLSLMAPESDLFWALDQ